MAITRKKIKNSMVITRWDIERHRMKFTYKLVITAGPAIIGGVR